jgi:short-subunit dehydrogenase
MRTLKDRVAVVTGAAGGIGRATAVALAKEGAHLALSDVNEEGLAETAQLVRAEGVRVCAHRVDVSDRERMRTWADEVEAEYGEVHMLVNNAGVTVTASFEEHTFENWDWIVGINFWGVIHGCKFFLPLLKRAEEGHIVNVSSVFGLMGVPMQTSYCATKFAVRGFSEALWVELKDENIGVTCVHPAGVKTGIARAARTVDDRAKAQAIKTIDTQSVSPERAADDILNAIKKGRMRQLVARDAYLIETMKRISPELVQRALHRGYRRMQSKFPPPEK